MNSRDFAVLRKASRRIDDRRGPRGLLRRLRFLAEAWRARQSLAPLLRAPPGSLLARTVAARPEVFAFVAAPYICSTWSVEQRLAAFVADIRTAEGLGPLFDLDVDQQIDVLALDHLGPDFWLVIDKPIWFHREGAVTLNIFQGQVRLFTIAFSVQRQAGTLVAIIGGIQGRKVDSMLDLYRDMTKASAGLRPRDLLLELFRCLCRQTGITAIRAVTDASRHHRSAYFKQDPDKPMLCYDEVWLDRGGVPAGPDFFDLPVARQDRDPDEIPARKRALYRKRYELLDRLDMQLGAALTACSKHPITRRD